jgi:hypothetical protein
LTRGGWHEHHHSALEPAKGQPDALTTAIRDGRWGVIAAQRSTKWQVKLRLGL